MVFVLSIVTCGIYLLYWYSKLYEELKALTGRTPTGNGYGLDLIIGLATCGIWGIYVDYKISLQLDEILVARGLPAQNSAMIVVLLNVAAYFTAAITYFATSAIQQDILNRIYETQTPVSAA